MTRKEAKAVAEAVAKALRTAEGTLFVEEVDTGEKVALDVAMRKVREEMAWALERALPGFDARAFWAAARAVARR